MQKFKFTLPFCQKNASQKFVILIGSETRTNGGGYIHVWCLHMAPKCMSKQRLNISIGLHNHHTVTLGQVKGIQYIKIK